MDEIIPIRLSGSKVIVRSNENEPYWLGELEGVQLLGTSRVPVVKREDNGERFLVMGIIVPHSMSLIVALDRLISPKSQYEFLKDIVSFRDELTAEIGG